MKCLTSLLQLYSIHIGYIYYVSRISYSGFLWENMRVLLTIHTVHETYKIDISYFCFESDINLKILI